MSSNEIEMRDTAAELQDTQVAFLERELAARDREIARLRENEERFRDFAESASDWLWELDEKLQFSYLSDSFERNFGWPAKHLLGKSKRAVYEQVILSGSEEEKANWRVHFADLEARRPFRDFVQRWISPHGDTVYIRNSGNPIFDASGAFRGYRGVASNITAQVEREQDALGAKNLLDSAVNTLSGTFVLWDADDRFVSCNDRFREINAGVADLLKPGTLYEEFLRVGVARGLYPEADGQGEPWVEERLERHRNPRGLFEVQRQDGLWILVDEQRMPDGGIASIATDVSDVKAKEEQLRRSAARYQLLMEHSPVGLTLFSQEEVGGQTTITRLLANQAMADLFGYVTPDEFLNADPRDSWADDETPEDVNQMLLRGEELENYEARRLRKDGSEFWISIYTRQIEIDGRQHIMSWNLDISSRKQAEAQLQESEARFRDFAETASDWLWETDAEGRFVYMTDPFFEKTGVPRDHVIGKTRNEVYAAYGANLSSQEKSKRKTHLTTTASQSSFNDLELEFPCVDGSTLHYQSNGRPIHSETGEFLGHRGTSVDISDRIEMQRVLQRSHDELEEMVTQRTKELAEAKTLAEQASEAKSVFLSTMSHELRTPLNAVLGFSQLLARENNLSPKSAVSVREIEKAGNHLLHLINEVLNLSRIEAGGMDLAFEEFDLAPLIDDALMAVSPSAAEKSVSMTFDPPGDQSITVWSDAARVTQILLNILSNAVKYNRDNGTVVVWIETGRNNNCWRVMIRDTGPGIADANRDGVFEPFNRLGMAHSGIEGTGIGLTLSRRIAEHMGAELDFSSVPGEGSTFWLELPATADEAQMRMSS